MEIAKAVRVGAALSDRKLGSSARPCADYALGGEKEEKALAAEALEALQRFCPMSLAATLQHYCAVQTAVRSGQSHSLY